MSSGETDDTGRCLNDLHACADRESIQRICRSALAGPAERSAPRSQPDANARLDRPPAVSCACLGGAAPWRTRCPGAVVSEVSATHRAGRARALHMAGLRRTVSSRHRVRRVVHRRPSAGAARPSAPAVTIPRAGMAGRRADRRRMEARLARRVRADGLAAAHVHGPLASRQVSTFGVECALIMRLVVAVLERDGEGGRKAARNNRRTASAQRDGDEHAGATGPRPLAHQS